VVPYGVDLTTVSGQVRTVVKNRPLRVLTLGEVCLRKGSHYVLQAAKRLAGKVEFRMAGPMGLLPERADEIKKNIDYVGIVDRREVVAQFAWADVFLLPSLCEGSATATYEALGAGLPVVATPSTGSILEHGVSGFIVPERDVDTIVASLENFLQTPKLLEQMSQSAVERSRHGSLEAYGQRLRALFSV